MIIVILIIIILAALILIKIRTCRKEGFFYWNDTPEYMRGAFDYQSALFAANLSNMAYYINTPQQGIIQQFMNQHGLKFNPIDNLHTYINTDTAFLWATDTKNRSLYFSFRGTLLNEQNIQTDLYQTLVPFIPATNTKANVSKGFLQAWLGIRNDVMNIISKIQPNNIFITGHSLGAALASLCAFDVKYHERQITYNIVNYNFASPRVGDIGFATVYNQLVPKTYRIQNIFDPVPRFPTTYQGYMHIKDEVLIAPSSKDSKIAKQVFGDVNTAPQCSINASPPSNYPYDPFEHQLTQYLTVLRNLIKDGVQCPIYKQFNIRSYCSGGNTQPAFGQKQCIY